MIVNTDTFGKVNMHTLGFDPAQPDAEQAAITLMFPNDTKVDIKGDPEVVTQLLNILDKQEIFFHKRSHYE